MSRTSRQRASERAGGLYRDSIEQLRWLVPSTFSGSLTMGTSPSKGNLIEADSRSFESSVGPASITERMGGKSRQRLAVEHQEEKKEESMSAMAATPRTNPKLKSFEAQGRVDRQIKDKRNMGGITDDQVHVNLAMADLMAYLQVVANNSNNLPLTRRDDPELGRMVSNLTSEEYAQKSAAFIPADVRVIAGSFLKYGRVWDLPTGEEYNAEDGAQEPGRSYGGACSNAMLKVLYDAANDVADAAQTMEANEALFDDDEDEEDMTLSKGPAFNRNSTFASIDMNDHFNPSTISWAALLRKMKAEIKDIEFAQVPAITSTRKFDLNQPFSLVPESFDSAKGKRRSLLIGCNYNHLNGAQLKASHDDIRSIKDYIVNVHGFPETDDMMTILLDDDDHKHPTFLNITEAFKALSEQSQPGDAVFIHFSGHGGRVLGSATDSEAESYDEAIIPSDYNTSGLVRDTLIFKTLLAPMRYGVTVTILVDACDTGMMLDLPYGWSTKTDREGATVKMTQNDDFSFVRFLKVVKTLYESSTFTQLGKTVGSALIGGQPLAEFDDDEETYEETEASRCEDDTATELQVRNNKSSFLSMFGVCGSPEGAEVAEADKAKKSNDLVKEKDNMTIDTRESRGPVSLLEQMMTCTFGTEVEIEVDDISATDTFNKSHGAPSYSENEIEDSTTYESSDDGYESAKRGRGRSRRRKH